jgi:hypothetical protein
MKTKNLQITAVLLILAAGFSSCKEEKENEPIEISFTEYSLAGASCRWTNFDLGKVTIINSNTALEEYVTCTEGTFPEIDFSKNTLLLARGVVAGGIGYLSKRLLLTESRYVLEIEITLNDTAIAGEYWKIVLVTDKLKVKDVELNVITIKN